MIVELRRKFVAVTMAAVTLVLAVIMVAVNAANYLSAVGQVDAVLDVLCANGGAFPGDRVDGPGGLGELGSPGDPDVPGEPGNVSDPGDLGNPGDPGALAGIGKDGSRATGGTMRKSGSGMGPTFSPETPYDTRYFTVDLDAAGAVTADDLAHIAAVSQDDAQAFAQELFSDGAAQGFVADYRFRAVPLDDGATRYVFVDAGRGLESFRSFRTLSLLVSVAGLVCVLGVSIPLSARAVRPVARAYDKQKRFITDASHELKTPLSIIGADAEVLELEQGENEWTGSIKAQVERMTGLVQKMLFLARMDEGGMKFTMQDFSLSDAVARVAESFEPLACERGATMTCAIAPGVRCCGDRDALEQVVSILLDNALKYCGEKGTVRVGLEPVGKRARLTVWNTAEGLPSGALDVLFERFHRQDSSRNSLTGGHGVGLSIAQAIVEAHKGKIAARSDDGASLTCTVVV